MVDTRGNPRFKGPGSLGKVSWRHKVPFTEMEGIVDFAMDAGGQYYQSAPGVLKLEPANGFFLGAVVGFQSLPAAPQTIIQNGDVANEGYLLQALEFPAGSLSFRFDVFGGAGSVANVISGGVPIPVTPGFVETAWYRVVVGFIPPDGINVDGQIRLAAETGIAGTDALTAPYLNSTPRLRVGRSGATAFLTPNCVHGLVAGEAPWADEAAWDARAAAWWAQVEAERQIVPMPEAAVPIPVTNDNGWRANNPPLAIGAAPDPWLPFVGADNLTYANGNGRALTVESHQVPFATELYAYPYA